MSVQLAINSTPIKRPDSFSIERYNLTKAGRVASGLMTLELVAKKRKFLLRYNQLTGTDLSTILSLIDTDEMFFTLSYTENGVTKTATCYAGHIPSDYLRGGEAASPLWYWKDVNFDLIEQ